MQDCPPQVTEMGDPRYSSTRPQHFPVHRAGKEPQVQVQVRTPRSHIEHKDSPGQDSGLFNHAATSGREGRTVSRTPVNCTHRGHMLCESEVHQEGARRPLGTQAHLSVKRLELLCSLSPSAGVSQALLPEFSKGRTSALHTQGSVPSTALRSVRSESPANSLFRCMAENRNMSAMEVQKAGHVAWGTDGRSR